MATTLAQDIEALMTLGHNLERATELAIADRAITQGKTPQSSRIIYLLFTCINCVLLW